MIMSVLAAARPGDGELLLRTGGSENDDAPADGGSGPRTPPVPT